MWLSVGLMAAKAIMTAVNIVEKNPGGLKGSDKTDLALNLLQDLNSLGCDGAMSGVPLSKEVAEARQDFIKSYVALQNAIAAAKHAA